MLFFLGAIYGDQIEKIQQQPTTPITAVHRSNSPPFSNSTCRNALSVYRYAEELALALSQLSGLKSLYLDAKIQVRADVRHIGSAFSSLTHLTNLRIGWPSHDLLDKLAPHLPQASLETFILDLPRAEELDEILSGNQLQRHNYLSASPCVGALASKAQHLTSLRDLKVHSRIEEFSELAGLLMQLTSLTRLSVSLLSQPIQNPEVQCLAENKILAQAAHAELLRSFRKLPELEILGLQFDCWYDENDELMFRPAAGGLVADPVWARLRSILFHGLSIECAEGTALLRVHALPLVLCACGSLEDIICHPCFFTPNSIKMLSLCSSLPCLKRLDLTIYTTSELSQSFARALVGLRLPSLQTIRIEVNAEVAPFHGHAVRGVAHDACFRSIMKAFAEADLQSLQELGVYSSTASPLRFSTHSLKSEIYAQHAQRGRELGTSIAAILQSNARLEAIELRSAELTAGCMQLIAPGIGGLKCLTQLQLEAADIGALGARALCAHVSGHTALASLAMEYCAFDDSCVKPLSEWVKSLPELREVSFDYSQGALEMKGMLEYIGRILPKVDGYQVKNFDFVADYQR